VRKKEASRLGGFAGLVQRFSDGGVLTGHANVIIDVNADC
jgi:hypothetical protein